MITGATGPEVRAALGDGSAFGAKITYMPQDAPLGLAHCVLIAGDFLGDDDFVMYLGDNLLEQDLVGVHRRLRGGPAVRRSAVRPDPAQAGSRPASFRHRDARRARPRRRARREARRPAFGPRPRRRVPVRRDDPRRRAGDLAVGPRRAGDHRRHPVADHQRQAGAHRAAHRLVDRHRQADPAARGQPTAAGEDRRRASTARSTRSRRSTGACVVAEGAEIVNSTIRGPVAIGRGHADRRQLHRSVQCHRQRVRGGAQRGRALGRDGRIEDPRTSPGWRTA